MKLRNLEKKFLKFLQLEVNPEIRQFMNSREMLIAMADNNVKVNYAINIILVVTSLLGFTGLLIKKSDVAVFPQFPSILVYIGLFLLNSIHLLILIHLKPAAIRQDAVHVLNISYANFLLNAIFSGLTLFSTQQGSSLFFELVLIMFLVTILPCYRISHIFPVIAASFVTSFLCLFPSGVTIAWQDRADLGIFYFICISTMLLRRIWFANTAYLQTKLARSNDHLTKENRTDILTGLNSRAALRQDFPAIVNHEVCMAMIDIDDFKNCNDTFGHVFGDQQLQRLGTIIHQCMTLPSEQSYRYGGDEFLIISLNEDPEGFQDKLRQIQTRFAHALPDSSSCSVSMGMSYGHLSSERSVRSCLQQADDCLYEAKASGKKRIVSKAYLADYSARSSHEFAQQNDRMTGLDSYRIFFEQAEARQKESPAWTVIFFDIDHFQGINKFRSYQTGDKVLIMTAKQLKSAFPGDPMARSDADHFVVFTRRQDYIHRIEAVQKNVSRLLAHNYIFLRAGIYDHKADSADTDLRSAVDMARYACDTLRQQSSQSYRIYDSKLAASSRTESFVLARFNDALDHGNIIPYFQPIVGASSGKTCGFEILARWKDPDLGLIPPGDFIPVLERSYDTYQLDFYMLKQLCKVYADMNADRRKNLFFTFNLSRTDFDVSDVPARINRIVDSYQIPHSALRIEITESAIIDNDKIKQVLHILQKDNYKIWLDDFGSGMSSMSVLQEFPVDGVKLDMKFMQNFDHNSRALIIIRTLIELSHNMHTQVVSEGVQTKQQLTYIRLCGGDYIQGFYYAKPMSLEELQASSFWSNYVHEEQLPFYQKVTSAYFDEAGRMLESNDLISAVLQKTPAHTAAMRISASMQSFLASHPTALQSDLIQHVLAAAADRSGVVWQSGMIDGALYLVMARKLGSYDGNKTLLLMDLFPAPEKTKEDTH